MQVAQHIFAVLLRSDCTSVIFPSSSQGGGASPASARLPEVSNNAANSSASK